MVQIRHVPDDIHRKLKVRATQSGMALSEFLLREVSAIANRPTLDEVVDARARAAPGRTGNHELAGTVLAPNDGMTYQVPKGGKLSLPCAHRIPGLELGAGKRTLCGLRCVPGTG